MSYRSKFLALIALCSTTFAAAKDDVQPIDGSSYYLPKTAMRFTVLIEKSTYNPGEYAVYSEKYLNKKAENKKNESYRILEIKASSFGMPDKSKQYTAAIDSKHSIEKLQKDSSGVLVAINMDATPQQKLPVAFKAAPKAVPLNPRDYMTQEMISAGSEPKKAELVALEIYDIRESRSMLSKGQADFMPKDGEQLRLMLSTLETQEKALTQLFQGTIETDTIETTITFVPEKEVNNQVLFRFSKKLGLVDYDDLAGEPYYISVNDEHQIAKTNIAANEKDKKKEDAGVYTNLPGKIKVTLSDSNGKSNIYDLYAAQFGNTVPVQAELFGKKLFTKIILSPITGHIEKIETNLIKK